MISPSHDPGIAATIIADIRSSISNAFKRLETIGQSHPMLDEAKAHLANANERLACHPSQPEGIPDGYRDGPGNPPQSDAANLKAAGQQQGSALTDAATTLYLAAHWTPDPPLDNADKLWEDLRDAAGIPAGMSANQDKVD